MPHVGPRAGVRPWNRTGLGGSFDRLPGVVVLEASWPTLSAAMERIRSLLVTRAGMLCNVTIDAASWRRFKPELTSFLAALPSSPVAQSSWQIGEGPSAEALIIPASVNYVGKGANLYRLGLKPSGELNSQHYRHDRRRRCLSAARRQEL